MPVSDSLHTAFPCPVGAGSCWPHDTGFLRHQSPDQSTFQAVSLGEEENGLFPPLEETLHFGSIPELIGFCVSWSLPGTWWGARPETRWAQAHRPSSQDPGRCLPPHNCQAHPCRVLEPWDSTQEGHPGGPGHSRGADGRGCKASEPVHSQPARKEASPRSFSRPALRGVDITVVPSSWPPFILHWPGGQMQSLLKPQTLSDDLGALWTSVLDPPV